LRKTKIICTLGPATNTVEKIEELIDAGMNLARLNFSHGTHESHRDLADKLKRAREAKNVPVALVLDTKGPEIRVKKFENGTIELEKDQKFTLTTRDIVGDNTIVAVNYEGLPRDLQVGNRVLVDDGLIELIVESIEGEDIHCVVKNSATLKDNKGVNTPDNKVTLPSLTEKDKEDIVFGIKEGFDFIAASFIRSKADVNQIRKVLRDNGGDHLMIIAKIENREGVNNLDEILEVADGIMVARGDLGVEISAEEVPLVQKSMIRKSNAIGKPVVTATQMLESMIVNPRPTRAEVSDVANAIFDGTDAIMLSGESANGAYPIEAVSTMSRIAEAAEVSIDYYKELKHRAKDMKSTVTDAISYAASAITSEVGAVSILTVTNLGFTARMLSKRRPYVPIVALTDKDYVQKQMNLSWGVVPVLVDNITNRKEVFAEAVDEAAKRDLVKNGDTIVIVAGMPLGKTGATNNIRVHEVGQSI